METQLAAIAESAVVVGLYTMVPMIVLGPLKLAGRPENWQSPPA